MLFYILLFQLLRNSSAFPHCSIQTKESKGAIEEGNLFLLIIVLLY